MLCSHAVACVPSAHQIHAHNVLHIPCDLIAVWNARIPSSHYGFSLPGARWGHGWANRALFVGLVGVSGTLFGGLTIVGRLCVLSESGVFRARLFLSGRTTDVACISTAGGA
eukprot:7381057-Prymnesium_polylepis.1